MKKELTALILALAIVLSLAACVSTETANPRYTREPVHKIGVIVYNTGDNEVIAFRDYLKGYIESNFEMVEFVYSESILNREQELEFIQRACDEGVEGFMSFLSYDLAAEVALCEKNQVYYLLASGTVAESSAISTTERVADWPGHCLAQALTKSSTIFLPMSTVGMEVLLESLVSQSV